jgi:ABC-type branched-subunit amino acid transport system substrate-binding protein
VIASQLAFFSIDTRVLGSGEWNNLSELNLNKRYCQGVLFESDSYLDTKSPAYIDFSARFTQRFNKLPSRTTLYGYATAKLILAQIARGVSTREEMKRALSAVDGVELLHGKISLFPRRVNSWLQILEYANEAVTRLTEINVE